MVGSIGRSFAREIRLFLIAVQFFTRIPITGSLAKWVGYDPSWITRCIRYFPLVGLGAALGMAAVAWVGLRWFSHDFVCVVMLAFGVWLTGAFHEDGFADFCDGFGGGRSAESTLEIMRDSRIGTYGTLGLIFLMLMKFTLLHRLEWQNLLFILCIAHTGSRACAVLIMWRLPYVESSIGDKTHPDIKPVAQGLRASELLPSLATPILVIAAVMIVAGKLAIGEVPTTWLYGLGVALGLCGLALVWMFRLLRRRLGGYTGDTLGATQQVTELAIMMGFCSQFLITR